MEGRTRRYRETEGKKESEERKRRCKERVLRRERD
jgi:hypothetical protein